MKCHRALDIVQDLIVRHTRRVAECLPVIHQKEAAPQRGQCRLAARRRRCIKAHKHLCSNGQVGEGGLGRRRKRAVGKRQQIHHIFTAHDVTGHHVAREGNKKHAQSRPLRQQRRNSRGDRFRLCLGRRLCIDPRGVGPSLVEAMLNVAQIERIVPGLERGLLSRC